MTLKFHVLNVQHGNSIVVEHASTSGQHFGLVDCNAPLNATPRAIDTLGRLGATYLSFICLTHPHKDHYSGLFEVIRRFNKNIGMFYSCPLGDLLNNRQRLTTLSRNLHRLLKMSDGETERKAALELLQILRWASDRTKDWEECAGFESRIAPVGFKDVSIKVLQPPRAVKGNYVNRIEKNDPMIIGHIDDNNLSIALQFEYCGASVIIGGDSTGVNWQLRERYEVNSNTKPLANAVVLPHHGSRDDNTTAIIDRLFAKIGRRYAATSANGISHPSPEVVQDLSNRNIDPYCTNLMPVCGANVRPLSPLPNIEYEFARFLRENAVSSAVTQPCQGDIILEISRTGELTASPQFNHFCGFRSRDRTLFE